MARCWVLGRLGTVSHPGCCSCRRSTEWYTNRSMAAYYRAQHNGAFFQPPARNIVGITGRSRAGNCVLASSSLMLRCAKNSLDSHDSPQAVVLVRRAAICYWLTHTPISSIYPDGELHRTALESPR